MSKIQTLKDSHIIRTKFSPPRHSHQAVIPDRLSDRFAAKDTPTLSLVTAAAGFGKTTLLSAWRQSLLTEKHLVAWLTLDKDDNDIFRFTEYLVHSLFQCINLASSDNAGIGNFGRISSPKIIITSLINSIDNIEDEITLFIDDYENITNPEINDLLEFLLDHIPSNLHLIIASRSIPRIPLSGLRARNQLVEIHTEDMRFTISDTKRFFGLSNSLNLSVSEIRTLQDLTEGWVAGLQMAAIVLAKKGQHGQIIHRELSTLISGQSKSFSEYITENIMQLIPVEMQEFMLKTSILERLSADLCNAVTDDRHCQEKLEWIERENIFFQSLDEENHWFRYHSLFADFLKAELTKAFPDELHDLHLRAATWFAKHRQWPEAVRHSISADRIDLATEWIEQCAMHEVQDSRVQSFLAWANKLPREKVRTKPRLYLAMAWALLLTMRSAEALAIVNDIERQLKTGALELPPDMMFELFDVRLSILSIKDEPMEAVKLGQQSLDRFVNRPINPDGDSWVDESTLNCLVFCHLKSGDLEKARSITHLYQVARDDSRNLYTLSYKAVICSTIDLWQGDFSTAAELLEKALKICERQAGRRSAAASQAAGSLARVFYEWNEFSACEDLLANRLDVIDDTCYLDTVLNAYITLSRMYTHLGNYQNALLLLDRAEALGEKRGWLRLLAACAVDRIRILLLQNNITEAQRVRDKFNVIANALPKQMNNPETKHYSNLMNAYLMLEQGEYREADDLLGIMLNDLESLGHRYGFNHILLLFAAVKAFSNDTETAFSCLQKVFDFASSSRLIRLFVDEKKYIAPLLEDYAKSSHSVSHGDFFYEIYQLVCNPSKGEGEAEDKNACRDGELSPFEKLTDREIDILRLVVVGLPNKKIARDLCIAPETVKWHLKNIYSKMGVSGRSAAAYQALKLKLIPEETLTS